MPELELNLHRPAASPRLWKLDRSIVFLNHGSFGACPRSVLDYQQQLRNRLETEPITFLVRQLEGLLDQARRDIARFVGAQPANLVLVQNATTGVNTVLRSLRFKAGDELLVTNHEYNACRNALNFVAERSGARVKVATIPFPLRSPAQVAEAVLAGLTRRTRLVLIDHVTSQTGLVLPLETIIPELNRRGIRTARGGKWYAATVQRVIEVG